MKLFQHPDFEQAIIRASEHFGARKLRPALVEKDYYVTEALRIIARDFAGKVIFKGGTSLSKGWNLIDRFSEDIDIFVDPLAFDPHLGKNGIDRELKNVRDAVAAHGAFTFVKEGSLTIGGFGRSDRFVYPQRFGGVGEVQGEVLIESGTASGRQPTENVELRSYLAQFLAETGQTLGREDEGGFTMPLLHFRRTFVEKLFAIHSKVEIFKRDGVSIGSYARHYYDLARLAERKEVEEMLGGDEYAGIKFDYDRISREHFSKSYFCPTNMTFANSEALFPGEPLAATLKAEYESQCAQLCLGPFPTWDEVQSQFERLKRLL